MKKTAICLAALLMVSLLASCAGGMGTGGSSSAATSSNPGATTPIATSGTTMPMTSSTSAISTMPESTGSTAMTSGSSRRDNTGGTSGGTGAGTTSGSLGAAASSVIGAAGSALSGLVSGMSAAMKPEDARIMFNNTLYKGSKEELRTDELGRELSNVTVVEKTPGANGEASGVEADSKLYAIKNVNDYSAIAFECGGVYYRAERQSA